MQQSCHCTILVFFETRPLCVCCSQHEHSQLFPTQIWLRLLPRKQWGLACQAQPVLWGDCMSLSLVEHLCSCLDLQPEAVAACLVFAMAGHWDVLWAQCLEPGPHRLLCAGSRGAVANSRLLCLGLMETGPGHRSWCSNTLSVTWLIWANHMWCLHVQKVHHEWQECSSLAFFHLETLMKIRWEFSWWNNLEL